MGEASTSRGLRRFAGPQGPADKRAAHRQPAAATQGKGDAPGVPHRREPCAPTRAHGPAPGQVGPGGPEASLIGGAPRIRVDRLSEGHGKSGRSPFLASRPCWRTQGQASPPEFSTPSPGCREQSVEAGSGGTSGTRIAEGGTRKGITDWRPCGEGPRNRRLRNWSGSGLSGRRRTAGRGDSPPNRIGVRAEGAAPRLCRRGDHSPTAPLSAASRAREIASALAGPPTVRSAGA